MVKEDRGGGAQVLPLGTEGPESDGHTTRTRDVGRNDQKNGKSFISSSFEGTEPYSETSKASANSTLEPFSSP